MDSVLLGESKALIKNNKMAAVATVSSDGKPDSAYFYYCFDENDNSIFFATTSESKKLQNLKSNSNIAISISDMSIQQEIQLYGKANIIKDSEKAAELLMCIHKSLDGLRNQWPLLKLHPADVVIVKVIIEKFKFSHFTHLGPVLEGTPKDWM